jgi:hypothetical protein
MNGTRIRLAFIFGQMVNDQQAEDRLREENKLHGDIIQGHFAESYRNMTLKSLTGLYWVSKYCSSARSLTYRFFFILKLLNRGSIFLCQTKFNSDLSVKLSLKGEDFKL